MKLLGCFKKVLILAVCFLCGCCTLELNVDAFSKREQYPYYAYAVKLQVHTIDNTATLIASGFAIDEDRIMTAGHFCIAAFEGSVKGELGEINLVTSRRNGKLTVVGIAEIEAVDEAIDLCVVERKGHGIPVLKFADRKPRVQDRVVVVGAPLGVFPSVSEGMVINPNTTDLPGPLNGKVALNVNATFGNSGSPVLNEDNEVIGVIILKMNDFLLFAVNNETTLKFLDY